MSHDENGHGGHHVLEAKTLVKTIIILAALTVLTVVLALAERADIIPLGALSVPVALAIAGTKATFVAMNFMGLKHDGGTNALAFVGGIIFLMVFLAFTYLDTGFRGVFDDQVTNPIDIENTENASLEARQEALSEMESTPALVTPPDTLLLPDAQITP